MLTLSSCPAGPDVLQPAAYVSAASTDASSGRKQRQECSAGLGCGRTASARCRQARSSPRAAFSTEFESAQPSRSRRAVWVNARLTTCITCLCNAVLRLQALAARADTVPAPLDLGLTWLPKVQPRPRRLRGNELNGDSRKISSSRTNSFAILISVSQKVIKL